MFESIIAWVLLTAALVHDDVLYYIAAAGFAVAAQISRVVDRMDGDSHA